MKKHFKHISTLAVAMIMAISLCIPALADEGSKLTTGSGDLTDLKANSTATVVVGVSNPDDASLNGGDTVLLYKVVDISYDEATNNLTYSFTKAFTDFQASDKCTVDAWKSLTPKAYGDMSEDGIKPLLGAFSAFIKAGQNPVWNPLSIMASEDGIATFNKVPMGQYIALGDGNSKEAKIYQTVTVNVEPQITTSENGKDIYQLYASYTVAMKTSKPSVEKNITAGTIEDETLPKEHQQTASIGDEITYSLKVNVPIYPDNATNKTFYVGDTLSSGLKFTDDSIVVKGYATEDDTTGTSLDPEKAFTTDIAGVAENGGTFYVDFDFDEIAAYHHVTVEYKATVTDEAKLGTTEGNPNDVILVYSNSPFDGNSWKPGEGNRPNDNPGYGRDEDKEIVYTYALVIDKFEEKNEGKKLAGATFELYTDQTCENPVLGIDGTVVTLVTDANGVAKYEGLKQGTYWIKETVAPTGYNLPNAPFDIPINAANIPYTTTEHQTVTHYTYTTEANGQQATINAVPAWMNAAGDVITASEQPDGYSAAYVKEATTTVNDVILVQKGTPGSGYCKAGIANSNGMHLPSTGGIGTTIFYVVGGLLMVGAVIVLITKRRMGNKE